ncbi:MAG: MHYT domain-containing protein, partial [Planktomarina sp.]|nr:MHYT domain-containing protein [Planktomarina sp.]
MEFIAFNHNFFLVTMSCIVAIVAGFTGLSLTRNLSNKSVPEKAISVALAAVALGGGIWSMHFVAMLGLRLPVLFYYDAAITLVSAFSAILIVGCALILLHFLERTSLTISAAGALVGGGILVMHY